MKFLSKSLFIFGCGYLGKQLASYFIKRNYRVGALTRNKKMANELINLGLKEVVIANLEDSSWHNKIRCNYNHVINCVGSGNGRVTNNAEVKDIQDRIAGYENSYFKGQQSIFKWLSNKKIKTFIYTSSTSVYSNNSFPEKLLEVDSDNMVLNCVENISLNNIRYLNPGVRILIETEELIRNKDNKFIYDNYFIYRLSGIYGPNRHRLLDKVLSSYEINIDSSSLLNLVHIDDIVKIIYETINSNCVLSGTYNISDDLPVSKKEVVGFLVDQVNNRKFFLKNDHLDVVKDKMTFGISNKNPVKIKKKIINSKIKNALNYKFIHPTYKEGFLSILDDFN